MWDALSSPHLLFPLLVVVCDCRNHEATVADESLGRVGWCRHVPWLYPKQFEQYYPLVTPHHPGLFVFPSKDPKRGRSCGQEEVPYPPEGYKITTDVPVMAPHDFSEDLGGYVDIWPLNITANVPVVNGVASRKPHGVGAGIGLRFPKIFLKSLENGWKDLERFRAMVVRAGEYDWSTMCDALPPAKGKEMKRVYWACISVRKLGFSSLPKTSPDL